MRLVIAKAAGPEAHTHPYRSLLALRLPCIVCVCLSPSSHTAAQQHILRWLNILNASGYVQHGVRRALATSPVCIAITVPTLAVQLEEDLADDLKWSMLVKEVLFSGKSEYQEVDLIHTGPFGKVRTCSVCPAAGCELGEAAAHEPPAQHWPHMGCVQSSCPPTPAITGSAHWDCGHTLSQSATS